MTKGNQELVCTATCIADKYGQLFKCQPGKPGIEHTYRNK